MTATHTNSRPGLSDHKAYRRRFWQHPLLAPLNDPRAWSRLLAVVQPAASLTEVRATVLRVVAEAPGVSSLWLQPNRRFRGFKAGQHLLLELEIDGARHARCFSLSHAPRADRSLRLTIKVNDGGRVSTAAQSLQPGQIVRISQAQGDFSPAQNLSPLLLISAGSGVTPMLSIVQDLALREPQSDVVLIQCGGDSEQILCADELRELTARWPNLRLHLHASATQGRLSAAEIAAFVPDWQQRQTLLCGPDGFMQMVQSMYAQAGLSAQLRTESYGRRAAPIDPQAAEHRVSHGNPEQVFTARAGQSLLEAAESAGLQPRFGCRRGICRSCQCSKRSGTVLNLLTNQLSGPGEELIQLCISSPVGAIDLERINTTPVTVSTPVTARKTR